MESLWPSVLLSEQQNVFPCAAICNQMGDTSCWQTQGTWQSRGKDTVADDDQRPIA